MLHYLDDTITIETSSFNSGRGGMTTMNNRKNMLLGIGGSVALLALGVLFLGHWGAGHWSANGSWWPMHHGFFGPGGMMGFGGMGIFSFIFWALVVFAISLLVAGAISRKNQDESATRDVVDSLEILKQRYARGEIDQEEFLTKRDILLKSNG